MLLDSSWRKACAPIVGPPCSPECKVLHWVSNWHSTDVIIMDLVKKNVTVWTDKALSDSCPPTMQTWWHIVTVMNIEALEHLQLNWKCGGQSVCCFWVFNLFLEWMNSVAPRDHPLHWTPNFTKLFQKLKQEIFGTALNWETLMKRFKHFGRMSILMETSGWDPTAKLDLRKTSSVNTRMINTIAENAIWRWSFIRLPAAFIKIHFI